MKPSCLNCRFSSFAHSAASIGECRRFAPRATLGQIEPEVRYVNPGMASFPEVRPADSCGEFQNSDAPEEALTAIVRETIFGDGTDASHQRIIDLCRAARERFEIERPAA